MGWSFLCIKLLKTDSMLPVPYAFCGLMLTIASQDGGLERL